MTSGHTRCRTSFLISTWWIRESMDAHDHSFLPRQMRLANRTKCSPRIHRKIFCDDLGASLHLRCRWRLEFCLEDTRRRGHTLREHRIRVWHALEYALLCIWSILKGLPPLPRGFSKVFSFFRHVSLPSNNKRKVPPCRVQYCIKHLYNHLPALHTRQTEISSHIP